MKQALLCIALLMPGCGAQENIFLCQSADGQAIRLSWTESRPLKVRINDLPEFSQNAAWVRKMEISPAEMALVYDQKIFYGDKKKNLSYEARLVIDYQFDRIQKILSLQEYYENLPDEIVPKEEREIKFTCRKPDLIADFLAAKKQEK